MEIIQMLKLKNSFALLLLLPFGLQAVNFVDQETPADVKPVNLSLSSDAHASQPLLSCKLPPYFRWSLSDSRRVQSIDLNQNTRYFTRYENSKISGI